MVGLKMGGVVAKCRRQLNKEDGEGVKDKG